LTDQANENSETDPCIMKISDDSVRTAWNTTFCMQYPPVRDTSLLTIELDDRALIAVGKYRP